MTTRMYILLLCTSDSPLSQALRQRGRGPAPGQKPIGVFAPPGASMAVDGRRREGCDQRWCSEVNRWTSARLDSTRRRQTFSAELG